jgi:hypothetical protein
VSPLRTHVHPSNAATQATIALLRAPVARTPRRNSWLRRVRPWAVVVAVSVVIGLLASWVALASIGWLPPVPPGPWAHQLVHAAPTHQHLLRCEPLEAPIGSTVYAVQRDEIAIR